MSRLGEPGWQELGAGYLAMPPNADEKIRHAANLAHLVTTGAADGAEADVPLVGRTDTDNPRRTVTNWELGAGDLAMPPEAKAILRQKYKNDVQDPNLGSAAVQ